jgi:hypothetical protein
MQVRDKVSTVSCDLKHKGVGKGPTYFVGGTMGRAGREGMK